MLNYNKAFTVFAILLCLNSHTYAQETNTLTKYPDYAETYLGPDKCENFNRKMFAFNLKLNKYAVKPIHTVWASIMPKYGIERIQSAYTNIEYPKRVISCLIQKDFKSSGTETVRFLTNTTLGLGGLFDPAEKIFKIKPVDENMDQALSKCNVNSGPYLVVPILSSTSPRGLAGKALDTALNPTVYVVTPILALVKAGLTVNRTSYIQPLAKMVESTYADPYDIAKKFYGIQNHIKCANLDRKEILDTTIKQINENADENHTDIIDLSGIETVMEEPDNFLNVKKESEENEETLTVSEIIKGGTNIDNIILKNYNSDKSKLMADMILFDYKPQCPIVDAMRTALFDLPGLNDSMWSDVSIWNRSFDKRIKTSSVNIVQDRENYKYKYILQKDKNAPIAIIYPSIGEGITSYHSVVLAKIFYDEGYSVIIQGSHFQWEFVKSMPEEYKPGIPAQDADYLKIVTTKILNNLQAKYDIQPREKLVFGTSFGALSALFLGDKEYKNNTLGNTRYIAVCPPVELLYAMKQVDKNTEEWQKNPTDLKNRVAVTAAKVLQLYNMKDSREQEISYLPFSEEEGKLITGFIMHQKLSDLIFTIENTSKCKKCCDFYKTVNNMNYNDYAAKYLLGGKYQNTNDLSFDTSLHSISEYLQNSDNYKIYHSLDDYLTNKKQLKQLKQYTGDKTVLLSNGSHLGFLYRQEFMDSLKNDIKQSQTVASK